MAMRQRGISYFNWRNGFSINESQFPNITIRWGWPRIFYVAISRNWKLIVGSRNLRVGPWVFREPPGFDATE
jgi:hypothetical protein